MKGVKLSGVFARYEAKRLAVAFLTASLVVFALICTVNLIELLRRGGGEGGPGFARLAAMAALQTPSVMRKTFPFIMLLSALWTYLSLARRSEVTAAMAAGLSFWGVAAPGALTAAAFGAAVALGFDPLAAASLDRFDRMEGRYFQGRENLLSLSEDGLWLREARPDGGQTVIQARLADSGGARLQEATFFEFDGHDRFLRRIDAESARLEGRVWRLNEASILVEPPRTEGEETLAPAEMVHEPEMTLPTNLTTSRIQEGFLAPEAISIWRLPRFIQSLEAAGFSARRHLTHFYSTLATPLMFAAMAVIAAAFAARPPRLTSYGLAAAGCALTGFALYFLGDVALAHGGSGEAPALLAAVAPALSAALAAAALAAYLQGS